jgi:NADPH:quinone reductase-like Zn-dependent oxidoreductase
MFINGSHVGEERTFLYQKENAMKYSHVLLTQFGKPADAFRIAEDDLPEPGEGQVRVKILAAGVAFADVMMRRGIYPGLPPLPFTPGYDMVGMIDAVGLGVRALSLGQMVAALTVFGSYSQYICLPAGELVVVPVDVDPAEASCLILNYVTAYQMLHRVAKVTSGKSILVHGAAGGVGTALLQLGALAGLQVYGTASTSKQELVKSLGAIPIDYGKEDVVARVRALTGGVDGVFDGIGGAHLTQSYQALGKGGQLVSYGISSGISSLPPGTNFTGAVVRFIVPHLLRIALLSALPDGKKVSIYDLGGQIIKKHPEWIREDLGVLLDLLVQGKIAPIIARRLPLQDVASAHELLEHAKVEGKLILLPN